MIRQVHFSQWHMTLLYAFFCIDGDGRCVEGEYAVCTPPPFSAALQLPSFGGEMLKNVAFVLYILLYLYVVKDHVVSNRR